MTQREAATSLAVAILLVISISAITLTTSHLIWQDEVQIVDEGRTILPDGDRKWGISWLLDDGRPKYDLNYLGPLLQETAFRLLDSPTGVRAAALAGAVLASLTMFGWLLARGVLPAVALFGALLFLVDPTISQSYRGARVDALAMGFMFLAFWAVHAGGEIQGGWHIRKHQVIAGGCVGVAGLVWPSVMILLPLLIYELVARTSTSTSGLLNISRNVLPSILYIGLFCVLTISVGLMLAFQGKIITTVADLLQNLNDMNSLFDNPIVGVWQGLRNILACFKYNLWLPAMAVILIAMDRRLGLIIVLLIAVTATIVSYPYIQRVIYLVPYLILAVVLATSKSVLSGNGRRTQLFRGIMVFMLAGSVMVTLGARTWTALYGREARNPEVITNMAESLIGEGGYCVYIDDWRFYYAGRRLGWRMYRSFYKISPAVLSNDWMKLASKMDYLIFRAGRVSSVLDHSLKEAGFEPEVVNAADYLAGPIGGLGRVYGYIADFASYGDAPSYIADYAIYQKEPASRNSDPNASASAPHREKLVFSREICLVE